MNTYWKIFPSILIIILLCAAGCIGPSQGKITRHDDAIKDLDQDTQEIKNAIRALRKSQADLSLEIDSMKQSLQTLQGTVEQNTLKTDRTLAETKNIQNEVLSVIGSKENQLSVMHNRLQVLESSSGNGTAPPPPAQKPPNSVSGNNIEGVWSPTPYSAVTKKQPAGSAGTAPQQTAALSPEPTPQGVYNEAYNVLQSGNNRSAREQFKKFLNTYKDSELADNAQFWIGESYYREKKFEEAILSFEDLIKNYPKSAKISEAYYKQALSFSAIKDSVAAKAKLEMLLNEYPDGELAQRAKQKLQEIEQQNPAETE
jgi:tol-pal system protein YbgF